MICPGCQRAADRALVDTMGLSADHLAKACRDIRIPGQGCTCQHDKGAVPHGQ